MGYTPDTTSVLDIKIEIDKSDVRLESKHTTRSFIPLTQGEVTPPPLQHSSSRITEREREGHIHTERERDTHRESTFIDGVHNFTSSLAPPSSGKIAT